MNWKPSQIQRRLELELICVSLVSCNAGISSIVSWLTTEHKSLHLTSVRRVLTSYNAIPSIFKLMELPYNLTSLVLAFIWTKSHFHITSQPVEIKRESCCSLSSSFLGDTASSLLNCSLSTVSRLLALLERQLCPGCHHPKLQWV